MSLFKLLFGRNDSPAATSTQAPSHYRELAEDSVCDGMVFCPTLKLSTPLWILKKAGEVHRGKNAPPSYGGQQDGVWIPNLHSDFDIFHKGETSASDAGSIDKAQYLKYAIGLLGVFESDISIHEKMKRAIRYAIGDKELQMMEQKICSHYNQPGICEVMSRFISFEDKVTYFGDKRGYLTLIDGVSKKIENALELKGIHTIARLAKVSEQDLLKIDGIGEKTASKIRATLTALELS